MKEMKTLNGYEIVDEEARTVSGKAADYIERFLPNTPEEFGAVGDGLADDTVAIESAVAYCRNNKYPLLLTKKYRITNTIDMRYIDVYSRGQIYVDHSGIGLIVGDSSVTSTPRIIDIGYVSHTNYHEGDISVRIVGLSNGNVTIRRATFVQLYADGDVDTDRAIAYSSFNIGTCEYLQITDKPGASNEGWINENTFYNCRVIRRFSIEGNTISHDSNVFYKPCFENAEVYLSKCTLNKFYDVRDEGNCSITFEENATFNFIRLGFSPSPYSYLTDEQLSVIDNGVNNIVTNPALGALKCVPFFNVNPNTVRKGLYEIYTDDIAVTEDNNLTISGTYQHLLYDAIIPVAGIRHIVGRSDAKAFLLIVTALDTNQEPMTNDPLAVMGVGWTPNYPPRYIVEGYSDLFQLTIANPEVKYLKLSVYNGTNIPTVFHNLSLTAYYDPRNELDAMELADYFKSAITT